MPALVDEDTDLGQLISGRNRLRQYEFLADSFQVWEAKGSGFQVSHEFICELNSYATQYLSIAPGRYRYEIEKNVTVGAHVPPPWEDVKGHMDNFVHRLNQMLNDGNPMETSAYALWRCNWIHPFVQGNGRVSRALSYFVLCQKMNHWFSGKTIPERIRATRDEYCTLLRDADATMDANGNAQLQPIIEYLNRLLAEQLSEG